MCMRQQYLRIFPHVSLQIMGTQDAYGYVLDPPSAHGGLQCYCKQACTSRQRLMSYANVLTVLGLLIKMQLQLAINKCI